MCVIVSRQLQGQSSAVINLELARQQWGEGMEQTEEASRDALTAFPYPGWLTVKKSRNSLYYSWQHEHSFVAAIGHVSIFSVWQGQGAVGDWYKPRVAHSSCDDQDRALVFLCELSRRPCVWLTSAHLCKLNWSSWALTAGGKMKIDDSKNPGLTFFQRTEGKESKGGGGSAPASLSPLPLWPPSIQSHQSNILRALIECSALG